MCGIYGSIGEHTQNGEILRILGILNEDRGIHSAGIAAFSPKEYLLHKKAMIPSLFCNSEEYQSVLNLENAKAFIGHARQKTKGDVNDNNAHPFLIGSIIGAHNGTVHNIDDLEKLLNVKYEVDSQYLLHLIDKNISLEKARGTLNVVYHDISSSNISIKIVRSGKPIGCAVHKHKNYALFSSDTDHIEMTLHILNIFDDFSIKSLKDDTKTTFNFKGSKLEIFKEDIEVFKYVTNYQYNSNYGNEYYSTPYHREYNK